MMMKKNNKVLSLKASRASQNSTLSTGLLGQTDKTLYEKVNGKAAILSDEKFEVVESVLPCPHDPQSLGQLYLEGQNKLEMEVQAAKKAGGHLVVLNKKHERFGKYNTNVDADTCLIEQ